MPDEGFLRRWARLKADPAAAEVLAAPAQVDARTEPVVAPAVVPHPAHPAADAAPVLPTLDDVARLDASSDFSAFVSKGVDKDVRRLAMKKLFSDPHFNLVDKLDVYMDDYNKPSPMSAEMLAALHHTKNLFAPLAADDLAASVPVSPNSVVPGIAGPDSPAQAVTHAEAPEPHHAHRTVDPECLDKDGREAAEAFAENDSSAFDANSATQFDIAAPGGVLQQTQQGNA
jgi:hypothetical protein